MRRNRRGGRSVAFLPALLARLQPIENAFAKLKPLLRNAARTIDDLSREIGAAIDIFTPVECASYFAAACDAYTRNLV